MSNQRQPALRPPRGIRLIDRPNRPSKFGVQWRVDGQRKTKVFETREDQIAFARQLAGGVKRDGMMAYRVNEDETRQWRAFRATIGPSANLNDIARCWLKHDVTAATLPLSEAIAAFLEAKAAEGGRTLLRQEGWAVGKRQIQRLRRVEGLRVPPAKRKIARRGRSTGLPTKATHRGHVWTRDFIAGATVRGGALRMLTVLDEHTRECHVLRSDRALKSADVIALVKQTIAQHGAPEFIRSDNGSEFIAHELRAWLAAEQIKTIYIQPASPWQNGFVKSFHSRYRDECLNRDQLWTLTEVRAVIEDFRIDYNKRWPHRRLGYRSPVNYAAQLTAAPTPVGLRPPSVGTASTQPITSTHNRRLD